MKRGRNKIDGKKGYRFPLSDVFEVTFTKSTKYHAQGEKKLVSLPVAIKLINDGKVNTTSEIDEAVEKYEMGDLLTSKKNKANTTTA